MLLLTFPGLVCMIACSHDLVVLVLGERWAAVAPILAVLGIDGFVGRSPPAWAGCSSAKGRAREMRNWGAVTSIIFIAAFAAGLSLAGVFGVACGYAAAGVIELVLLWRVTTRRGPVGAGAAPGTGAAVPGRDTRQLRRRLALRWMLPPGWFQGRRAWPCRPSPPRRASPRRSRSCHQAARCSAPASRQRSRGCGASWGKAGGGGMPGEAARPAALRPRRPRSSASRRRTAPRSRAAVAGPAKRSGRCGSGRAPTRPPAAARAARIRQKGMSLDTVQAAASSAGRHPRPAAGPSPRPGSPRRRRPAARRAGRGRACGRPAATAQRRQRLCGIPVHRRRRVVAVAGQSESLAADMQDGAGASRCRGLEHQAVRPGDEGGEASIVKPSGLAALGREEDAGGARLGDVIPRQDRQPGRYAAQRGGDCGGILGDPAGQPGPAIAVAHLAEGVRDRGEDRVSPAAASDHGADDPELAAIEVASERFAQTSPTPLRRTRPRQGMGVFVHHLDKVAAGQAPPEQMRQHRAQPVTEIGREMAPEGAGQAIQGASRRYAAPASAFRSFPAKPAPGWRSLGIRRYGPASTRTVENAKEMQRDCGETAPRLSSRRLPRPCRNSPHRPKSRNCARSWEGCFLAGPGWRRAT